jgi:hypothetical protein
MVGLLALAHDRGCEAELAAALGDQLSDGGLPDLAALHEHFAPVTVGRAPEVTVTLPLLASYDALLAGAGATA